MIIDNQAFLDAALEALAKSPATYTDAGNGAQVQGLPFTDLIQRLRERGWKNISRFNEGDLQDSGFKLARHTANPNRADIKADLRDCRGRKIGQWTTIITL